jgi:hypothetical protein
MLHHTSLAEGELRAGFALRNKRLLYISMLKKIIISLILLPFLTSCSNAARLNQMHESEALRLVNQDLEARVQRLNLQTPGYILKTVGRPGAGSYGGNGVFIGLMPKDGGKVIDLPLEYDYSFTLSNGDSQVNVRIIYSPSDEELRSAVGNALSTP